MKSYIKVISVGILLALPGLVSGESVHPRSQGTCFSVKVMADHTNRTEVRQDCDINISRVVQAGSENRVETWQTGRVNDNRVRQYEFHGFSSRPVPGSR